MRGQDIRIGMHEGEVREAMGAPYLVQLAGVCMTYRWQDAEVDADVGEWLRVRLRRIRGRSLAHAVVDEVEGRCNGVAIALP